MTLRSESCTDNRGLWIDGRRYGYWIVNKEVDRQLNIKVFYLVEYRKRTIFVKSLKDRVRFSLGLRIPDHITDRRRIEGFVGHKGTDGRTVCITGTDFRDVLTTEVRHLERN